MPEQTTRIGRPITPSPRPPQPTQPIVRLEWDAEMVRRLLAGDIFAATVRCVIDEDRKEACIEIVLKEPPISSALGPAQATIVLSGAGEWGRI